jgi:hypothetical protein
MDIRMANPTVMNVNRNVVVSELMSLKRVLSQW